MKLSAPIYYLKRKARLLSREANIPLHAALDRIAAGEGFSSWSLLAAKAAAAAPAGKLFTRLVPGDLILVAARPGHGKTLMSLELAVEAMKAAIAAYSSRWNIRKAMSWSAFARSGWIWRISTDCSNSTART